MDSVFFFFFSFHNFYFYFHFSILTFFLFFNFYFYFILFFFFFGGAVFKRFILSHGLAWPASGDIGLNCFFDLNDPDPLLLES